jgi:hypothetical protein
MPPLKREITTREAVKLTPGMSEATLQRWLRDAFLMKARPCPFGDAVYTGNQWTYFIWPERLEAYRTAQDLILRCALIGKEEHSDV